MRSGHALSAYVQATVPAIDPDERAGERAVTAPACAGRRTFRCPPCGMRPTRIELATFGLKDRRSLDPVKGPLTTELRAPCL